MGPPTVRAVRGKSSKQKDTIGPQPPNGTRREETSEIICRRNDPSWERSLTYSGHGHWLLLSRNPNQPVFWHFPVLSKHQGRDTIGGARLFHAKIRKYFAGGRVFSSLPIVCPKVFAQFPDVSP